ncbi:venom protease-like isoform X2 [Adelges cooleyi]|uniref:venom protease-like isoform X2 n=1 Tax=Adelges cooleyi TaxID=133065 RepID=UPI00217F73DC|nr:venom protease-like isoform X2 [Adelges cooleyi]
MEYIRHLVILILALEAVTAQSNNECFTPNEENGVCINIKRCPFLLSLLENQRKNASIVTFLRNSMCGYEGRDPKVCCPLESEVSNGNNGGNNENNNNWNNEQNSNAGSTNSGFGQNNNGGLNHNNNNNNNNNGGTNSGFGQGNNGGSNHNNNNNNGGSNLNNNNGRPTTTSRPTSSSSYETVTSSKLPSQSTCGRSNATQNRIVGGAPADLDDWPWMVALGYQDLNNRQNTKTPQWLCGGALISDRYVVTAAHCTVGIGQRKLAIAHLGDLDLDSKVRDGAAPVDVPIERVMTHESYNAQDYTNDIALLKLETVVRFNQHIQPICLPIMSDLRTNLLVKSLPFVAGWGSTSFRGPSSTALMEVQVPVVDNSECKRSFANKRTVIDERVLCAGYLTGGKDACQGDSGGPLMWPSGKQYYLVGVVSFGFKCAEPGYPGVYTRVTHFVEWIAGRMNNS